MSTHSAFDPHPLHSPNVSDSQMMAYYAFRTPARHKHSLVERSLHDQDLLSFFEAPIDIYFVRELVKTAESVIRIHDAPVNRAPLPTPPITPVKGNFRHRQPPSVVSPYAHPKWRPLEQFIIRVISKSNVCSMTLAYALIVLDRVRDRLPPMAQGMPCTRHRVFLAALIVASKYLNDQTPKNKHWAACAQVFDCTEISLMEKQMLTILDWDLRITEEDMLTRLHSLMYPQYDRAARSKTRQEAVKKVQENSAARRQQHQPHTPITPSNAPRTNNQTDLNAREVQRTDKAKKEFILQPVPTSKKRQVQERSVSESGRVEGHTLSVSQSDPSGVSQQHKKINTNITDQRPYLALPAYPPGLDTLRSSSRQGSTPMSRARSYTSDGVYSRSNSASLHLVPTLSSSASSSLLGSALSTSSSTTGSEVNTPADRVAAWIDSSYKHEDGKQDYQRDAESFGMDSDSSQTSESLANSGEKYPHQSRFLRKLLGVGKNTSPSKRVGYGVKGGERKVSTATTIVPEDVQD